MPFLAVLGFSGSRVLFVQLYFLITLQKRLLMPRCPYLFGLWRLVGNSQPLSEDDKTENRPTGCCQKYA